MNGLVSWWVTGRHGSGRYTGGPAGCTYGCTGGRCRAGVPLLHGVLELYLGLPGPRGPSLGHVMPLRGEKRREEGAHGSRGPLLASL